MVNAPYVLTKDEVTVDDPREILLAEFVDGPEIRELALDQGEQLAEDEGAEVPTRVMAQALGLRLLRVISQDRKVVAQLDPEADAVDLSFFAGRESTVLATARPGSPYCWQLLQLGPVKQGEMIVAATGARVATEEESAVLNAAFPNWLAECEQLDARVAAS